MPNDCINRITVYADDATIKAFVDADYRVLDLVPPMRTDTSDEVIAAYSTDKFYSYKCHAVGHGAIHFTIYTAWVPPIKFLEILIKAQKGIGLLKCDWTMEDGPAGLWVAQRGLAEDPLIQSIEWDEGCIEERADRFRPART